MSGKTVRAAIVRVAAAPIALVLLVGATAVPAGAGPAISGTALIEASSTYCVLTLTVKNLDANVTSLTEFGIEIFANDSRIDGLTRGIATDVTNGTATVAFSTQLPADKWGRGNFDQARVKDKNGIVLLDWPRVAGTGRLRVTNRC